jgi:hypothetical protein
MSWVFSGAARAEGERAPERSFSGTAFPRLSRIDPECAHLKSRSHKAFEAQFGNFSAFEGI